MQTLIIDGLTNTSPKDLSWAGMPNNAYITIRNRTADSTLTITQGDREMSLEVGKEGTFFVKDSANDSKITLSINKQYKFDALINSANISILDNTSDDKDNNYFVANVYEASNFKANITLDKKVGVCGIPSELAIQKKYLFNTAFPATQTQTLKEFFIPNYYTAKITAGRGHLIKSVRGVDTTQGVVTNDIYTQESTFALDKSASLQTKQLNIEVDCGIIPYANKITKEVAKAFNDSLEANNKDFELPQSIAQNMFIFEASLSDKVAVFNNKTHSQITELGKDFVIDTQSAEAQSYNQKDFATPAQKGSWDYDTHAEYKGYDWLNLDKDYTLGDSRMWNIDNQSAYGINHEITKEIRSIAFTLKTTSQDYPYTIAFTSPMMSGITFLSDSSVKVYLGNREVLYNGVTHLNLTQRYLLNYEADNLQLYINGEAMQAQSQTTLYYKNKQINTIGIDLKQGFTTEQNQLNLKLHTMGSNQATIKKHNQKNDYVLDTSNDDTLQATPAILDKISDSNATYTTIPFGSYLNDKTRTIHTIPHIWQKDFNPADSITLSPNAKEFVFYGIGSEAKKIELSEESISGLISVAVSKDRTFDIFKNLGDTQAKSAYKFKYVIKANLTSNGTARVVLSGLDSSNQPQTQTLNIITKES